MKKKNIFRMEERKLAYDVCLHPSFHWLKYKHQRHCFCTLRIEVDRIVCVTNATIVTSGSLQFRNSKYPRVISMYIYSGLYRHATLIVWCIYCLSCDLFNIHKLPFTQSWSELTCVWWQTSWETGRTLPIWIEFDGNGLALRTGEWNCRLLFGCHLRV